METSLETENAVGCLFKYVYPERGRSVTATQCVEEVKQEAKKLGMKKGDNYILITGTQESLYAINAADSSLSSRSFSMSLQEFNEAVDRDTYLMKKMSLLTPNTIALLDAYNDPPEQIFNDINISQEFQLNAWRHLIDERVQDDLSQEAVLHLDQTQFDREKSEMEKVVEKLVSECGGNGNDHTLVVDKQLDFAGREKEGLDISMLNQVESVSLQNAIGGYVHSRNISIASVDSKAAASICHICSQKLHQPVRLPSRISPKQLAEGTIPFVKMREELYCTNKHNELDSQGLAKCGDQGTQGSYLDRNVVVATNFFKCLDAVKSAGK